MMWRTWSTFTSICGGSGGMMVTSGWVCPRRGVSRLAASRRLSRASTASAKRSSSASASAIRVQLAHMPQKSGRSSVVGGCRQFMAFATICVRVNLPEPCAPDRITAWGKWSRASISRTFRTSSALPWKSANGIGTSRSSALRQLHRLVCREQTSADDAHDLGVDDLGRTARVYHGYALRLTLSDRPESLLDAGEERGTLLLEAVLVGLGAGGRCLVAAARALQPVLDVRVHQDCQVRPQSAAEHLVQLQHRVAAQLTSAALIGF